MLDNKKIDSHPIAEIESESSFYDTKGLKIETVGGVLYDVTGIVKSKLDGKFVANSEGEVYYVATDPKKYGWHYYTENELYKGNTRLIGAGSICLETKMGTIMKLTLK